MRHPFLKKNPLLSLWLSGANAVVGSARGKAATQARRHANAAAAKATRDAVDLWLGVWFAKPPPRRRRR